MATSPLQAQPRAMPVECPPRVLVLTNNRVQPFTGGGVVLTTLFHRFPRENLFVLHTDVTEGATGGYAEHRLARIRFPWSNLRSLLAMLARATVRLSRSTRKADLVDLVVQNCEFHLPPEVDARIREFRPDAIYAWAGDSLWCRLVETCARRYRLPYVIHFMDNHVELSGTNPIQAIVHAAYRRNLTRVVAKAAKIFTICNAMGVAYRARFRKEFASFHGLVDSEAWTWPGPAPRAGVFTLAFTGSLESGQLKGLRDVAAAVDRLARSGRRIRLVLYLTEFYQHRARAAFAEFENIDYVRHPDAAGLRGALQSADALVLAYGFDRQTIEYYRYSFATKVVPYMLSGRCILAYGPSAVEPIAYVQRGGWGEVVSDQGIDKLEAAIVGLVEAPDRCHRLARAAFESGRTEHDLQASSARFVREMHEVVRSRSAR